MKKKLLISALILLVVVGIVLTAVLVLQKTKKSRSFVDKTDPQVEYIDIRYTGGISGRYDKEIKVYQDGSDYRLYYRYEGDEDIYDLTKAEYLFCTDITPEYLTELEETKGMRSTDAVYESITAKFKGEDEVTIKGKEYSTPVLRAMKYYAEAKTKKLTGREFYAIQERLAEYYLENKVSAAYFLYQFNDPSSDDDTMGNTCYMAHVEQTQEEVNAYRSLVTYCRRLSDPDYDKDKYIEFTLHGKTAYYITNSVPEMISVSIYIPDDQELIHVISTPPEGMSNEKFTKVLVDVMTHE